MPETGQSIFEDTIVSVPMYVAEPDGARLAMPPTAASLTVERTATQVSAFPGPDCAGLQWNFGTLRTFTAGKGQSFRAHSF